MLYFLYINNQRSPLMLRLLRRLDAFLGADVSEPQNLHKRLYVWFDILTLPSFKAADALNKRTDLISKDEVLEFIENFKKLSNIFDGIEANIRKNYRVQFFDALLCHIYNQLEFNVTLCLYSDNFFNKNTLTRTIETQNLSNRRCMKTREEVLEYALCNNPKEYWEDYFSRGR
jgi:hypothetical protein